MPRSTEQGNGCGKRRFGPSFLSQRDARWVGERQRLRQERDEEGKKLAAQQAVHDFEVERRRRVDADIRKAS